MTKGRDTEKRLQEISNFLDCGLPWFGAVTGCLWRGVDDSLVSSLPGSRFRRCGAVPGASPRIWCVSVLARNLDAWVQIRWDLPVGIFDVLLIRSIALLLLGFKKESLLFEVCLVALGFLLRFASEAFVRFHTEFKG